MNQPQLLLLAVAYGNRSNVRDFCTTIMDEYGSDRVHIAVCDNSDDADPRFDFGSTVATVRPDNPGYWGGAVAAHEAYLERIGGSPAWVAITNTDLDYMTANMLTILNDHASTHPRVIAPRITEGALEKNPHVIRARPKWRLFINHLLTFSTPFAWAYLAASWLRFLVTSRLRGEVDGTIAKSGTRMYSPYGALIFFNAAFLTDRPLWKDVPLLAEEWAVAEMARERSAPVTFEPRLWVRHEAHQTTGPKVSRHRAVMLSDAFGYMWKRSQ